MRDRDRVTPQAREPATRAVAGWLGGAVLAAAVPLVAALASGHTLVTRDTARMFEPLRPLIANALREGRLPLWNPYEALGMPLFAQMQHGVLHPVSVLAAILVPTAGMDLFIVTYVLLATGGAFFLARGFEASPRGAAVAGVGFGLSGYVLSMSSNLPFLAAAGTAPWALAGLRAAGRGARLGPVWGALAFACLVFAGDPQWAAVSALLGLAIAWEAGGLRGAGRAGLALLVGGLLAGVQWLPTLAYLEQTSRATDGLSVAERSQWALAPWRLLELGAPGFFGGRPGSGAAQVFLKLGGPTTYGAPFVPSVHVGVVLLVLAGLGVRASRGSRTLAVAACLFLWMAMGVHLGADRVLRAVPVWGSFRYSEKLTGPLTLCLAVLAGLGLDRLALVSVTRWRSALLAGAGLLGAAMLVVGFGGEGLLAGWVGDAASIVRVRLLVGLAHGFAGLALLALALATVGASERADWALPGTVATLVFLQCAGASLFALHAGKRGVREPDPLRTVRAVDEITRIATPSRRGPAHGPPELDEADKSVYLESRMALMPYGAAAGIDHMGPYSPLWPSRYERVFFAFLRDFGPSRWVAWRRFAVNRIVVDTRLLPEVREEALAALDGAQKLQGDGGVGFSVWGVPHRPWAGFAPATVTVASEAEAYKRTAEAIATGDPAVVLEDAPPHFVSAGRILSFDRGAERVRIEAESEASGILFVNDAWMPGWRAAIDGAPVPLLRADVLVRAVPWPAGHHVLEMTYAPAEVRTGLWASLVGAFALVGMAWAGSRVIRTADGRVGDTGGTRGGVH
jgi:hypothetical protein